MISCGQSVPFDLRVALEESSQTANTETWQWSHRILKHFMFEELGCQMWGLILSEQQTPTENLTFIFRDCFYE